MGSFLYLQRNRDFCYGIMPHPKLSCRLPETMQAQDAQTPLAHQLGCGTGYRLPVGAKLADGAPVCPARSTGPCFDSAHCREACTANASSNVHMHATTHSCSSTVAYSQRGCIAGGHQPRCRDGSRSGIVCGSPM